MKVIQITLLTHSAAFCSHEWMLNRKYHGEEEKKPMEHWWVKKNPGFQSKIQILEKLKFSFRTTFNTAEVVIIFKKGKQINQAIPFSWVCQQLLTLTVCGNGQDNCQIHNCHSETECQLHGCSLVNLQKADKQLYICCLLPYFVIIWLLILQISF